MIPTVGDSPPSDDSDGDRRARDGRHELAAAGDEPDREPAHRGRKDHVDPEPLRVDDRVADRSPRRTSRGSTGSGS